MNLRKIKFILFEIKYYHENKETEKLIDRIQACEKVVEDVPHDEILFQKLKGLFNESNENANITSVDKNS